VPECPGKTEPSRGKQLALHVSAIRAFVADRRNLYFAGLACVRRPRGVL
jgi:hypothetical protein